MTGLGLDRRSRRSGPASSSTWPDVLRGLGYRVGVRLVPHRSLDPMPKRLLGQIQLIPAGWARHERTGSSATWFSCAGRVNRRLVLRSGDRPSRSAVPSRSRRTSSARCRRALGEDRPRARRPGSVGSARQRADGRLRLRSRRQLPVPPLLGLHRRPALAAVIALVAAAALTLPMAAPPPDSPLPTGAAAIARDVATTTTALHAAVDGWREDGAAAAAARAAALGSPPAAAVSGARSRASGARRRRGCAASCCASAGRPRRARRAASPRPPHAADEAATLGVSHRAGRARRPAARATTARRSAVSASPGKSWRR